MLSKNDKYLFLKGFAKNEKTISELLSYSENKFILKKRHSSLNDESFIKVWEQYVVESKNEGSYNILKKYLVQLQFPIQKGISNTQAYKDSTLKGKPKLSKSSLILEQPELIKFKLYNSFYAGKTPVIIIPNNNDFNTIIAALANKNEPLDLPESMGAICINGINNWDRIHRLKAQWLKKHPYGNWNREFIEHIIPNQNLYKDKIIILSTKPYSGISHTKLELSENDWIEKSLIIRREHECAHLFTLKEYGHMANNIHDEIIADYMGITSALGSFNKKWFLYFLGLENYPSYRKGGRLENYLGKEGLSKEAFNSLKLIITHIATNISIFDTQLGKIKNPLDQLNRVKSICELDLISLASPNSPNYLMKLYKNMKTNNTNEKPKNNSGG